MASKASCGKASSYIKYVTLYNNTATTNNNNSNKHGPTGGDSPFVVGSDGYFWNVILTLVFSLDLKLPKFVASCLKLDRKGVGSELEATVWK